LRVDQQVDLPLDGQSGRFDFFFRNRAKRNVCGSLLGSGPGALPQSTYRRRRARARPIRKATRSAPSGASRVILLKRSSDFPGLRPSSIASANPRSGYFDAGWVQRSRGILRAGNTRARSGTGRLTKIVGHHEFRLRGLARRTNGRTGVRQESDLFSADSVIRKFSHSQSNPRRAIEVEMDFIPLNDLNCKLDGPSCRFGSRWKAGRNRAVASDRPLYR
jgi:hypothetical protein